MKQIKFNYTSGIAFLPLYFIFIACGPQAFVPNSTASSQVAPGGMNLPPKVDIVLGMSSNGTMRNIAPGTNSEIPAFLKTLQKSGWDYRFVSIPLSEYHPTDSADKLSLQRAISVSQYDANNPVDTWLPPFPGATREASPAILFDFLAPSFNVSQILPSDPIDNHESGFHNQISFLNRDDVKNNFLRPDALLAVITLSNADDHSDWQWGAKDSIDQGHETISENTYRDQFLAIKGNQTSLVKYYSLVADSKIDCRGLTSWSGIRYRDMASLLNGQTVDICSNTVADSLAAISANLEIYRLNFIKKYLVVGTEPNVGTISVTKFNAASNTLPTTYSASVLSQNANDGWTYAGPVPKDGVNTVVSPVPMNKVTSGYLIELHGSAMLKGLDTADITYQNAGSVSSH